MKENFFNISYQFEKEKIWTTIDQVIEDKSKGYIVVADGVVANIAQRNSDYRHLINKSLCVICDSGWIPIYIKHIYGIEHTQYCGPMIFIDFIKNNKYRQFFLGANQKILGSLKDKMSKINPEIENMTFYELPFLNVEDFDYESIAKTIEEDGAEIIWVSLGAPKQDFFMQRLLPHLKNGVMIGVGAVFKYYSGIDEKRAPQWICNMHLEFIYRLIKNPKKQFCRCWWIIRMLPTMIREEKKKKKTVDTLCDALKSYSRLIQNERRINSLNKLNIIKQDIIKLINNLLTIGVDKIFNKYWFQTINEAITVAEFAKNKNNTDTHFILLLDSFLKACIEHLDKNDQECKELIHKIGKVILTPNH